MKEKQSNLSKMIYFIITSCFLFALNRYFSDYFSNLALSPTHFRFGINLHYMENTGAAFSILQNFSVLLIIFSIIAVILVALYTYKNLKNLSMMNIFWISLLISGICSNLYERIVFGFVKDYFEITFFNFPVFNLSDIFINIGVIIILFLLFKKNYKKDSDE